MPGFLKKWFKIDFLARSIAKLQFDTISHQVKCLHYTYDCIHGLILRVIFSGLIDLFKMKKSIHFSTI
ncbi:MAG: hypothetical protein EBS96_05475 [Spartobacteria bacterium]|nr:hypothetical protein [Spartobacteria bacterium]